jgi:hypothetical protein
VSEYMFIIVHEWCAHMYGCVYVHVWIWSNASCVFECVKCQVLPAVDSVTATVLSFS